jgi:hypothetical protein
MMRMCEQCGGLDHPLYLSPRGPICKHCVNSPKRGPDDLKSEYPDLWERYKE